MNTNHKKVIDYATSSFRSDFLDIWLMANCFFCISTGTGLDEVSRIFRKPSICVNYLPFNALVSYDHVLSVPKHLVWNKTNECLTLTEHLSNSYYKTMDYDESNIRIEELNSNEIKHAVIEFESRLLDTWIELPQDKEELQDRFWKIFKSHQNFQKHHGYIHPEARVGTHFLRNNPEWLN